MGAVMPPPQRWRAGQHAACGAWRVFVGGTSAAYSGLPVDAGDTVDTGRASEDAEGARARDQAAQCAQRHACLKRERARRWERAEMKDEWDVRERERETAPRTSHHRRERDEGGEALHGVGETGDEIQGADAAAMLVKLAYWRA